NADKPARRAAESVGSASPEAAMTLRLLSHERANAGAQKAIHRMGLMAHAVNKGSANPTFA
ncbi:MAG: hypothetical protein ACO1SX_13535, partial [Actinomycetota bacterium]